MGISRAVYGILWFSTLVAYSVPWARVGEEIYTGWSFTIPFSITYLIGLVLGLVVLITTWHPVAMTIAAGILMLMGVVGSCIALGLADVLGTFIGEKVRVEAGIVFALIAPVIYMLLGAVVGRRMQIQVG